MKKLILIFAVLFSLFSCSGQVPGIGGILNPPTEQIEGYIEDLSGGSYVGEKYLIPPFSATYYPWALEFNADYSKVYISDGVQTYLRQFSLTTPGDITTMTDDVVSYYIRSQDRFPEGIKFNSTGDTLIVGGDERDRINLLTLSTPFDLSTVSSTGIYNATNPPVSSTKQIKLDDSGTRILIANGSNNQLYYCYLTTPFLPTTYVNPSISVSFAEVPNSLAGGLYSKSGSKLYVFRSNGAGIYQYTLTTPFDITTAVYDNVNISTYTVGQAIDDVIIDNINGNLYYLERGTKKLIQYSF